MSEHNVWAKIEHGRVTAVHLASHPGFVPATLTIPDEPEWVVWTFPFGECHIQLASQPWKYGNTPTVVRAPDAQTALAKALAERHGG